MTQPSLLDSVLSFCLPAVETAGYFHRSPPGPALRECCCPSGARVLGAMLSLWGPRSESTVIPPGPALWEPCYPFGGRRSGNAVIPSGALSFFHELTCHSFPDESYPRKSGGAATGTSPPFQRRVKDRKRWSPGGTAGRVFRTGDRSKHWEAPPFTPKKLKLHHYPQARSFRRRPTSVMFKVCPGEASHVHAAVAQYSPREYIGLP
jgi:hypothetical protein